jgi:hypothetical protein
MTIPESVRKVRIVVPLLLIGPYPVGETVPPRAKTSPLAAA